METKLKKKTLRSNILVDDVIEPLIIARNKRRRHRVNAFRFGLFGSIASQIIISMVIKKTSALVFLAAFYSIELVLSFLNRSIIDIFFMFKKRKIESIYPCRECLLISSCTEFCEEVKEKRHFDTERFISERCCVDCGHNRFDHIRFLVVDARRRLIGSVGPDAYECRNCGHYFNFDLQITQRIYRRGDEKIHY